MKTFLLALSACTLAAFNSYAQTYPADTTATPSLKPQAKHVATELNINPFNGTISLNNSINQLKFRYFTSPNVALRLGFTGSKVSNLSEDTNPYGTSSYHHKDERSTTTVGVNVGVEKHFTGTRRLSPYIGADIVIAKKSTEQEITNGENVTTITGAWRTYSYNSGGSYMTYAYGENGYFRYGLNLLTGFDFYMSKNFFFGYEVNFGFTQSTLQELKVEESNQSDYPADNKETKNTSFTFGPSLMNGVRVGFVF